MTCPLTLKGKDAMSKKFGPWTVEMTHENTFIKAGADLVAVVNENTYAEYEKRAALLAAAPDLLAALKRCQSALEKHMSPTLKNQIERALKKAGAL
jgi:hypothetical protein